MNLYQLMAQAQEELIRLYIYENPDASESRARIATRSQILPRVEEKLESWINDLRSQNTDLIAILAELRKLKERKV